MTPPVHPVSGLRHWVRGQSLCRHVLDGIPRRPAVLVVLVLLIGTLTVTAVPVLIQSGNSPTPVTGANESATTPGAQLASAISGEGAHLNRELHQRTLDTTPSTAPNTTGIENDTDDDSEEETETDDDTESDDDADNN